MSDSIDHEEGEVESLSDFEDLNTVDNGVISPLESNRADHHGASGCRDTQSYFLSTGSRGRTCGSLLELLSDDDRLNSRRKHDRTPTHKHSRQHSLVKRKKRKRLNSPVDPSRRHEKRKPRVACKFFFEGRCTKGADCPFSHTVAPAKKQELCKFYAAGGCSKGPSCSFLHGEFPCKFFHLNHKCNNGSQCRFSHEPLTPESKLLLDKIEENNRNNRASDAAALHRDGSDPRQMASSGDEFQNDPYGDVDYRRMVPQGPPVTEPLFDGIPSGFIPLRGPPSFRVHPRDPRVTPRHQCPVAPSGEQYSPMPGSGRPFIFRGRYPPPRYHSGRPPFLRPQHLPQGPRFHQDRSHAPPTQPTHFSPPKPQALGQNQSGIGDSSERSSLPTDGDACPVAENEIDEEKPENPQKVPKMIVDKNRFVQIEDDSVETSSKTFEWRLLALEVDRSISKPPAGYVNPGDPRLRERPKLPTLLNFDSLNIETKKTDANPPRETGRKRRPNFTLNACANPLVTEGLRAESKTSQIYSNIQDPRLIKRRRFEEKAATLPPRDQSKDGQDLTPKPLQVVLSPTHSS